MTSPPRFPPLGLLVSQLDRLTVETIEEYLHVRCGPSSLAGGTGRPVRSRLGLLGNPIIREFRPRPERVAVEGRVMTPHSRTRSPEGNPPARRDAGGNQRLVRRVRIQVCKPESLRMGKVAMLPPFRSRAFAVPPILPSRYRRGMA
jgi:hypothetical protein